MNSNTQQSRTKNNNSINSLLSLSTVTTNTNQSNQSNYLQKLQNNPIPKTQINLFNHSTKKTTSKPSIIPTSSSSSIKTQKSLHIFNKTPSKNKLHSLHPQRSTSSVEISLRDNNNTNFKSNSKQTLNTIQPKKRQVNSISVKIKYNDADSIYNNERSNKTNAKSTKHITNIKSSSNIMQHKSSHSTSSSISSKYLCVNNNINNNKASNKSFVGITANNSSSNVNIRSCKGNNVVNMKMLYQNKSNNNILPKSKNVLPRKVNVDQDKMKTVDHMNNDNINYKKKKLISIFNSNLHDNNEKQFRLKLKKYDNINNTNKKILLNAITKLDNILTNHFQGYINKLVNEYDSQGNDKHFNILNCNLAQAELLLEMESIFYNIKDSNSKITLINKEHKYTNTEIHSKSESYIKTINQYFDKCHNNFNTLSLLIQKLNKDNNRTRNEIKPKNKSKQKDKKTIDNTTNHNNKLQMKYKKVSPRIPTKTHQSPNNNTQCTNNCEYDIGESQLFETQTPNKQLVMLPKANNFNVQKPKEQNLNYKPYISHSDIFMTENDENDVNVTSISKVIIGEIEAYKDIIEEDKLCNFAHQKSKSSFNLLHSKVTNKKDLFENLDVLNEESQISNVNNENDLSSNNHNKTNEDEFIKEIDDDFEIEEEDFEIDDEFEENTKSKKQKHKIPFHVSKVSFSRVFDNVNGEYKITENIENNCIEMVNESDKRNSESKCNKDKMKIGNNKTKIKKLKSRAKKHSGKENGMVDNTILKEDIRKSLEIQNGRECVVF